MRVRGDFDLAIAGIRNLHAAGVPVEINYSPTLFNVHEIGLAVDLAYELGAYSFYTGRTMYTGNAVKTWHRLVPAEEQYAAFSRDPARQSRRISRPHAGIFSRNGAAGGTPIPPGAPGRLADRTAERAGQAHQCAAVCVRGLRRQPLEEIWGNFQRAGGTHEWRNLWRTSRRIPVRLRGCINGSSLTPGTRAARDSARRTGAGWCGSSAWCVIGSFSMRAPALSARRGMGLRYRRCIRCGDFLERPRGRRAGGHRR